jgi:hypothetical protein
MAGHIFMNVDAPHHAYNTGYMGTSTNIYNTNYIDAFNNAYNTGKRFLYPGP